MFFTNTHYVVVMQFSLNLISRTHSIMGIDYCASNQLYNKHENNNRKIMIGSCLCGVLCLNELDKL